MPDGRDDDPDVRIDVGDGPDVVIGYRVGDDVLPLSETDSGTVALWRDADAE